MSSVVCSICGRELEEDYADICLSCGRIICPDEYDSNSGFCRECAEKGPYSEC